MTKLHGGHIYRYGHYRESLLLPVPDLGTDSSQNPFADCNDQARVLRNAYESIGHYETQFRTLPSEESFHSCNSSAADIRLWLVHKEQFLPVDRQSQAVFQGQSFHEPGIHLVREKAQRIASLILGAIHGGIGILDQRLYIPPMLGEHGNSQTATYARESGLG